MLDFKELPVDGNLFELLVREILFQKGLNVHWSGKGADGGRDLLCIEKIQSEFCSIERRWLVQCKHKAHSESAVGISDLDNIIDSCGQHSANGYLLVCSTYPSSALVTRLESLSSDKFVATYWDSVMIERVLQTPKNRAIAQRFFPISANQIPLTVYATENPNYWVANYKGYYFHLSNRIGSNPKMHLGSISATVLRMEGISLPVDHQLRLRAVHFDDKNGNYTWYIDYMRPSNQSLAISPHKLATRLGHSTVLEDGQFHYLDVLQYTYSSASDHYDPDHYDYYVPFVHIFRTGFNRSGSSSVELYKDTQPYFVQKPDSEHSVRNTLFQKFMNALANLPYVKIIRGVNCNIEYVDDFCFSNDVHLDALDIDPERFFSVWVTFTCNNFDSLTRLFSQFPQGPDCVFSLCQRYVFLPESGWDHDENDLYDLTIRIVSPEGSTPLNIRTAINNYLSQLVSVIESN